MSTKDMHQDSSFSLDTLLELFSEPCNSRITGLHENPPPEPDESLAKILGVDEPEGNELVEYVTSAEPQQTPLANLAGNTKTSLAGAKSDLVDMFILNSAWPVFSAASHQTADDKRKQYLAFVKEAAPESALEGIVIAQLIVLHLQAMQQFKSANSVYSPENADRHNKAGQRLLKQFSDTLKSLQRLKGQHGKQEVTVKHVNVMANQAIVGDVVR
ncbi:hypothetical protein [Desulfonatronum parangueonense]